uniref:Neuron navigator 1 n=1 Tax=Pygocentrus nattereri TaxID=42514 RepID=A0AAR2IMT6_PYGNA
ISVIHLRHGATTPLGEGELRRTRGMAAKKGKSGLPQATPRADLSAYRSGSSEGRVPLPTKLRKEKSLTSISVLTDSEKKMQLYQHKWADDMTRTGAGQFKARKPKDSGGGANSPLSKNLSKSEHSLFQGKPKGFSPLQATSALSKPSRIPRGLYAEVKPISKAEEATKSSKSDDDDEVIHFSKVNSNSRTTPEGCNDVSEVEEGDKTFLKVDPQLVVTVLGDLEQLLFSQVLDPDSQRKRTVQNVLDLRQNLEDTMSSLRGSQLTHSTMCYDSDDTNAPSVSSLSSRSSPLSWQQGQASPRLQAGDAPSSGGTTHILHLRSSTGHFQRIHFVEGLDAADDLADLTCNYLTDGGLTVKNLQEDEDADVDQTGNCWDESSSISSGLSDGSDNLSSEEFNASSSLNSLPTTPIGSRRNSAIVLRTDAEKHSLVESGLSWYSEEAKVQCRSEGCYDTGSLKMESSNKLKKYQVQDDAGIKGELRKPQAPNHQSSLKKSRNPPVGITSPITHNPQSLQKALGGKVVDKAKMAVKSSGLQRSCSDAGKDQSKNRKPVSGLLRPSAGTSNSFGFKKPAPVTGTATVLTPTGNSVSVASTTKTSKSSGIPVKPSGGSSCNSNSCKTSIDVSNCNQGVLAPNSRNNIQYRSLPRPAKSNTLSLTGSKAGPRPVSSNVDSSLLSLKPVVLQSKLKEPGSGKSSGRIVMSGSGPVNQTDREKEKAKAKAVVSDSECGGSGALKNGPSTPTENIEPPSKLLGLRHAKTLPKPTHLDKVNSNSLDCSIVNMEDHLPPNVLPYSKLQNLSSLCSPTAPGLTPSPAPILNVNCSDCFSGSPGEREGRVGSSPLLYPRLSGLHHSMESLPLQMSLCPAGSTVVEPTAKQEERSFGSSWSASNKASLTVTMERLVYVQHASSQSKDGTKERRHSHIVISPSAINSPPQLPSPTLTSKIPLNNIVAHSPGTGTPRMTRSNSIPAHETGFELYQASPLGSTLSLAERPRTMMRSGSFRDKEPGDDVHGSVLSLASSASSSYSSFCFYPQQIRKLRRELESSQEKVASLTSQLSANANLVAAFEQSLTLMTTRLQSLSVSAEQKDSELMELRKTIENLKARNIEAQAVIQVALNNPDVTPKELRIKRQNSSESIASLNSITSHSSMGSLKEDAKKKKKKNWLRSSFGKAFSIKKGTKSGSLYSDIEEIATPDSSAPSSPKLNHEGDETMPMSLQSTQANSSSVFTWVTKGETEQESEEKVVSELRSELWEKEMKLTDIRLEALNSAHQLEQLREAMNNMQVCQHLMLCTFSTAVNRLFIYLFIFLSLDNVPMEVMSLSSPRGEVRLRVVVGMADQPLSREVLIDSNTDWATLDTVITTTFQDYISQVDPSTSMGLSVDSIHSYSINQVRRELGDESPDSLPSYFLNKGPGHITVTLKGFKEKCVDSLVFETLIPKPMMQHYISLLLKHRRLILSGPSGTGKTHLTSHLADYLLEKTAHEGAPGHVVTFNMHQQTCKELQLYLSNLANQIDHDCSAEDIPLVIVLDDVSDAASISELVNSALTCKYHKCPYIIGTTNQPVKMSSNHGLHLSFRMVTFSNNVEPANGFLLRYLHRKLIEAEDESTVHHGELLKVLDWVPKLWYHLHTFLEKHSTSDFLIGPCFFLSCPVTLAEFRSWFIDLWNQSIIPYLQEGAKDGMKVHCQKAVWEDPVEWVRDTLPWPSAQQDQAKLLHLPPPIAGPNTVPTQSNSDRPGKDTQLLAMESDPLMAMLLKLQESANYIESPERNISLDPSFQATL